MSGGTYLPIADYALIADSHAAALVSRYGSIDWCCLPRFDSPSVFARLLDHDLGGHWTIAPVDDITASSRRYIENTLVLETDLATRRGRIRITDLFRMPIDPRDERNMDRQLIRIVEGLEGDVDIDIEIEPRFDYGEIAVDMRRRDDQHSFAAYGASEGVLFFSEVALDARPRTCLIGRVTLRPGDRRSFAARYVPPYVLDGGDVIVPAPDELEAELDETIEAWSRWAEHCTYDGPDRSRVIRSGIVLKALSHQDTGAVAAAPTTSLPESLEGGRNWDYRFSWIRDSTFTVKSLAEIGYEDVADAFRRFVERTTAASAESLQIMYGIGGERRLTEVILDHLEGYRGIGPVRIGNDAARQLQLDVYGALLNLSWRWHASTGQPPDDDYWRFLVELADAACEDWTKPDRGIWEVRGPELQFTHSKAMCWSALDRAVRLADRIGAHGHIRRWTETREEIRDTIESRGYDATRGIFVRELDGADVDAALLLLPEIGFVDWKDERMKRTADAVEADLGHDGLVHRYRTQDGLAGEEAPFLACSFWLAECYARQDRMDDARRVFERACSTANDLGLFSEEATYDGEMMGNFPQALSHLAHIGAALALAGIPNLD